MTYGDIIAYFDTMIELHYERCSSDYNHYKWLKNKVGMSEDDIKEVMGWDAYKNALSEKKG